MLYQRIQCLESYIMMVLSQKEFCCPILSKYPFELSGGMAQRVAIALAVVNEPAFLLADEPTSALDVVVQKQTLDMILDMRQKLHMTMLMVTHNMRAALALGNRTLMMNGGQIILDVSGEERTHMDVDDLLKRFRSGTGKALDNDRILLS